MKQYKDLDEAAKDGYFYCEERKEIGRTVPAVGFLPEQTIYMPVETIEELNALILHSHQPTKA